VTRNLYYQIATLSVIVLLLAGETLFMLSTPLSTQPIFTKRKALRIEGVHAQIDVPENRSVTLAEIQARPLFLKSRRPYRPPAPQITAVAPLGETEPTASAESFTLKGVFLRPPLSKALIVSPANPEGIWVAHGGEIEGWKIEEVAASEVRLAQQKKTTVLTLYHKQGSR
jgi:hypothetical protein